MPCQNSILFLQKFRSLPKGWKCFKNHCAKPILKRRLLKLSFRGNSAGNRSEAFRPQDCCKRGNGGGGQLRRWDIWAGRQKWGQRPAAPMGFLGWPAEVGAATSCADGIFGLAGRSGGSGQLHRWDFRAGRQNGGVTRGGGRGRISDPLGGEEKYFPPGAA